MKNKIIVFDEDLVKVLEKQPNMSEYVRNCVRVYNDDILTGMDGIKTAFRVLKKEQDEHFALYDKYFKRMNELMDVLEIGGLPKIDEPRVVDWGA